MVNHGARLDVAGFPTLIGITKEGEIRRILVDEDGALIVNLELEDGKIVAREVITEEQFYRIFPKMEGHAGMSLGTDGKSVIWQPNSSSVSWGSVVGDLSAQTDIKNILDNKQPKSSVLHKLTGITNGIVSYENGEFIPLHLISSKLNIKIIDKEIHIDLPDNLTTLDQLEEVKKDIAKLLLDLQSKAGKNELPKIITPNLEDCSLQIATTEFVKKQGYLTKNKVVSVNGKDDYVVLSTSDVAEGDNKYFTESRVAATKEVIEATRNKHSHKNHQLLETYTKTEAELVDAVKLKHQKVSGSDGVSIDENQIIKNIDKGSSAVDSHEKKFNHEVLVDLVKSAHTHVNQSTLNKVTDSIIENSHSHNNSRLLSEYVYSNADLAEVVDLKHPQVISGEGIEIKNAVITNIDTGTKAKILMEETYNLKEVPSTISKSHVHGNKALLDDYNIPVQALAATVDNSHNSYVIGSKLLDESQMVDDRVILHMFPLSS